MKTLADIRAEYDCYPDLSYAINSGHASGLVEHAIYLWVADDKTIQVAARFHTSNVVTPELEAVLKYEAIEFMKRQGTMQEIEEVEAKSQKLYQAIKVLGAIAESLGLPFEISNNSDGQVVVETGIYQDELTYTYYTKDKP